MSDDDFGAVQDQLHEIYQRILYLENKMSHMDTRFRDNMADFLRGQSALTVRFDRFEAKQEVKDESI